MKYRLNLTYEDLDILDYSTIKGVGLFRSEHIMSVSNEYITQEKCKNLINTILIGCRIYFQMMKFGIVL
jgi:hypothetical protein